MPHPQDRIRSWYLLGVLFKFSDKQTHPFYLFIWELPLRLGTMITADQTTATMYENTHWQLLIINLACFTAIVDVQIQLEFSPEEQQLDEA